MCACKEEQVVSKRSSVQLDLNSSNLLRPALPHSSIAVCAPARTPARRRRCCCRDYWGRTNEAAKETGLLEVVEALNTLRADKTKG